MGFATSTHDRLNHAFDLLLVLIGIITASILQYISTLGSSSLITFGMRFMFIPLIPLILSWILRQITDNQDLGKFIDIFAWFYGIFTLFSDLLFFFGATFIKQFATHLGFDVGISSIVLYAIAVLLNVQVYKLLGFGKKEFGLVLVASSIAIVITAIILYVSTL